MKRCPYCSGAIRGIHRACPHCGSELREGNWGIIIVILLTIIIVSGAYLYLLGEDGRAKLIQRAHESVELAEKRLRAIKPKEWIIRARKKMGSKSEKKVERQFKSEDKGKGKVEIKLFESGKLSRGMTKDEVRALLGKPEYQQGPVGDPPIERWGYPDQVIVFESGYVIDSFYRE